MTDKPNAIIGEFPEPLSPEADARPRREQRRVHRALPTASHRHFSPGHVPRSALTEGRSAVDVDPLQYPFRTIGKVRAYEDDKWYTVATGVLIGQSTVLTVGEVLWRSFASKWPRAVSFEPAYPKGGKSYWAQSFWVREDLTLTGPTNQNNFGVIKLGENIGDELGWVGLSGLQVPWPATVVGCDGYDVGFGSASMTLVRAMAGLKLSGPHYIDLFDTVFPCDYEDYGGGRGAPWLLGLFHDQNTPAVVVGINGQRWPEQNAWVGPELIPETLPPVQQSPFFEFIYAVWDLVGR